MYNHLFRNILYDLFFIVETFRLKNSMLSCYDLLIKDKFFTCSFYFFFLYGSLLFINPSFLDHSFSKVRIKIFLET